MRTFFERLDNPHAATVASECYENPIDVAVRFPRYSAGKAITIPCATSTVQGLLSPTSLAVRSSDRERTTIITRVSDTSWAHAEIASEMTKAVPLPDGRGFVSYAYREPFRVWQMDAEQRWFSTDLGAAGAHACDNIWMVHAQSPLVAVVRKQTNRVELYRPGPDGSWSGTCAAEGEAFEKIRRLIPGPGDSFIGICAKTAYLIHQRDGGLAFEDIHLPLPEQGVHSAGPGVVLFDDFSICVTSNALSHLFRYDSAAHAWNVKEPVVFPHSPGDVVQPLAPDRFLLAAHNSLELVSLTSRGWQRSNVMKGGYIRGVHPLPDGRLVIQNLDATVIAEPHGSGWITEPVKGMSREVVVLPRTGLMVEFCEETPGSQTIKVWKPMVALGEGGLTGSSPLSDHTKCGFKLTHVDREGQNGIRTMRDETL